MKRYSSIEEWRKDWSPEKQKQYKDALRKIEDKFGIPHNDPSYLIHSRELEEISGVVVFKIPIK